MITNKFPSHSSSVYMSIKNHVTWFKTMDTPSLSDMIVFQTAFKNEYFWLFRMVKQFEGEFSYEEVKNSTKFFARY